MAVIENPGWLGMVVPVQVITPYNTNLFPPYVPGETNVPVSIPVWLSRFHQPNLQITGGGGSGTTTIWQQGTIDAEETVIFCTVNSGVLPENDNNIALVIPSGVLLNPDQYTVDRDADPNEIILGIAPDDPMQYFLILSYPPV